MARGAKRQKKDDFFEDEDTEQPAFGDDSDARTSSEEEVEDVETAEEKRLRLAKSYLDKIQQLNEDEEDGAGNLTDRLRNDALVRIFVTLIRQARKRGKSHAHMLPFFLI